MNWQASGFKPHPGQIRAFNVIGKYNHVWICAGRRGGKSELLGEIGWDEFIRRPETCKSHERYPRKVCIIAPQYRQARIIFRKIYQKAVYRFKIPLRAKQFSSTGMYLERPNGSMIATFTAQNLDAIPGEDWDWILADEFQMWCNERTCEDIIFPMLLDGKGKFVGIGTPDSPGSYDHDLMVKGLDPDNTRWGFSRFSTVDNWYIPHAQAEIDEMRANGVPEDIIQRVYFAQYIPHAGLVYPEYEKAIHPFELSDLKGATWWRGVDFGYTNPFACLIIAMKDDQLYVWDEFVVTKVNDENLFYAMSKMDNDYFFRYNLGDPEAPEKLDYFSVKEKSPGKRLNGQWVKFVKPEVKVRNNSLRIGISTGRVHVHPRCKHTIKEFGNYKYPEVTTIKNYSEVPIDKDNHCMDALGYVWYYQFGELRSPRADIVYDKLDSLSLVAGY